MDPVHRRELRAENGRQQRSGQHTTQQPGQRFIRADLWRDLDCTQRFPPQVLRNIVKLGGRHEEYHQQCTCLGIHAWQHHQESDMA